MLISLSTHTILAEKPTDEENNDYEKTTGLINLKSQINVFIPEDYDFEPIKPESSLVSIPIIIQIKNVGLFAKSITRYFNRKHITQNVELSLGDIPNWCTATIDPGIINFEVNTEYESYEATLSVGVSYEAPAFKHLIIPIIIKSDTIKGFLKIRSISGIEEEIPIALTPDYINVIDVSFPKIYYKISPTNTTNIPIKIKNLGNGKSDIKLDINNLPSDWKASYPKDIVLEQFEEREIILKIKPSHGFGRKTLNLNVKSTYYGSSYDDENIASSNYTYMIQFEEDDSHIFYSSFPIIPIIIILIIMTIILYIYFRRRKK